MTASTTWPVQPIPWIVMSPYVDLTLSGESLAEKREADPLFTPDELRARVPDYVGGPTSSDPYISPIFADRKIQQNAGRAR